MGPKIIIFIVGGMTYSEIRSVYEVMNTKAAKDATIYIGKLVYKLLKNTFKLY